MTHQQARSAVEQHDIIEHYQAVADCCQSLFTHASQGAWADLITLQGEYVGAVEQLAVIEHGVALDTPARERKRELLIEIRATEDAVRALLEERMHQLSHFIVQSQTQRRLRRAYSTG
jgi:flagellar protein FliT